MNDLNCIKEGLLEYINLSISIHDYYFNKRANSGDDLAKKYKLFCLLKEEIIKSDSLDKVYQLKEEIHLLEKIIELGIKEEKKSNLHSRERALVERGYDVDDVLLVSSYTKEYVRSVAEQYFNKISQGCSTSENPICIFLGGQPGVGKTTTSMKIKSQFPNNNIIEIGIDNYRTLHPKYLEIESLIKNIGLIVIRH